MLMARWCACVSIAKGHRKCYDACKCRRNEKGNTKTGQGRSNAPVTHQEKYAEALSQHGKSWHSDFQYRGERYTEWSIRNAQTVTIFFLSLMLVCYDWSKNCWER